MIVWVGRPCPAVCSLRELWEGNGNSHSNNSVQLWEREGIFFEDRYRVGEGVCEDVGQKFQVF